jgi:hypothetical protein
MGHTMRLFQPIEGHTKIIRYAYESPPFLAEEAKAYIITRLWCIAAVIPFVTPLAQ